MGHHGGNLLIVLIVVLSSLVATVDSFLAESVFRAMQSHFRAAQQHRRQQRVEQTLQILQSPQLSMSDVNTLIALAKADKLPLSIINKTAGESEIGLPKHEIPDDLAGTLPPAILIPVTPPFPPPPDFSFTRITTEEPLTEKEYEHYPDVEDFGPQGKPVEEPSDRRGSSYGGESESDDYHGYGSGSSASGGGNFEAGFGGSPSSFSGSVVPRPRPGSRPGRPGGPPRRVKIGSRRTLPPNRKALTVRPTSTTSTSAPLRPVKIKPTPHPNLIHIPQGTKVCPFCLSCPSGHRLLRSMSCARLGSHLKDPTMSRGLLNVIQTIFVKNCCERDLSQQDFFDWLSK